MTTKPPRPGAHGEGITDVSHAYLEEFDAEGTPVVLLTREARRTIERELKTPAGPRTEKITVAFEIAHAHPEAVLVDMLKRAGLPRKVIRSWQVLDA